MSTSKHFDKICIVCLILMLAITGTLMCAKSLGIPVMQNGENNGLFAAEDTDAQWSTDDAACIVLNEESAQISGNGAYFSDGVLHIAYSGKYVLSGTLHGSVEINTENKETVWLLFDGVEITSDCVAPLYVEQAGKVILTLGEGSKNTLTMQGEADDVKGALFSRDNLTVNGKGALTVCAENSHGIVCNDTLVFAGGTVQVTAGQDGIHANDAIKICHTDFQIAAQDDGIHAGSEENGSVFYMESGSVDITECYEGIEANLITFAGGTAQIQSRDDGINANGTDSDITVSGGEITILNPNAGDVDGMDSNGDIHITGGNVFISINGNSATNSALDYNSEGNGVCVITGGTVVACGGNGMAEGFDESSTQGFIMETVSGSANETVTLLDAEGNVIVEKEIPNPFSNVQISTPAMKVGDTVTLQAGENTTEITIDNVAKGNGMPSFGNFGGKQGGMPEGGNPFGDENATGTEQKNNGDGEVNSAEKRERPSMPSGGKGGTPPNFKGNTSSENSGTDDVQQSEDFTGKEPPEGFAGQNPPEDFDPSSIPAFSPNGEDNDISAENRPEKPFGESRGENGEEKGKNSEAPPALLQGEDWLSFLIAVGVSALILLIGILIAWKKKKRV